MSYLLSMIGNDQFLDSNGNPLAGGKLFTYLTGTSTKAATYTDNTGGTNQTNPIVLNASGFPTTPIYLDSAVVYKFVLAPATDGDPPTSIIYTWNDVKVLDAVITVSEQWVVGTTPTFASTTSFTLVGDQTAIYHIGRRVKLQSTIATLGGTISASVFSSVTTITVVLDTSVLDATLNAVWYSILTAVNSSVPGMFSSGLDLTTNRDLTVNGITNTVGARNHTMTATHNLIPAGTILAFAGAAAPTGYSFCDGAAVLRATYTALLVAFGGNVSSTVTITIASPGVISWASNPLQNHQPVAFTTTGALPTGITANTQYYVLNRTGSTFQISATPGGTAINTSGSQSGTHTGHHILYGVGDNSTTFNLPDYRGRAIIMVDGAAARITSASTNGANADTLGGVGGAETHTLVTAEMPTHSHDYQIVSGDAFDVGGGGTKFNTTSNDATTTAGGGGAHSNTQPWITTNYMIRLY